MRLEIDQIAGVILGCSAEEVMEAYLEQIGDRGVGGDMSSQFRERLVCAHYQCQGIPAVYGGDALLKIDIARIRRLRVNG
jgi:hypothetical protein